MSLEYGHFGAASLIWSKVGNAISSASTDTQQVLQ